MSIKSSLIYVGSKIPTHPAIKSELIIRYPWGYITDATVSIRTRSVGVVSKFPAAPVNMDLAMYKDGENNIILTVHGDFTHNISDCIIPITIGCEATFVDVQVIPAGDITITLKVKGDIWLDANKKNFVKWSNIGEADFTIWKDNVAGERPVGFQGWVWAVRKLGNKLITYGEGGIVALTPAANTYGMQRVLDIGILSQKAMAGDEDIHFFIDSKYRLWSISEGPKLHGYEEFLSLLVQPTLSWDNEEYLLYICDGESGFIYSPRDGSLGKGPKNITGITNKHGQKYVTASFNADYGIEIPKFGICTDIIDAKTRKYKTITDVEVGVELDNLMYLAYDYRMKKSDAWTTTPWKAMNPDCTLHYPCYGLEFRIRLRLLTYEYFEIDYVKFKGFINHFSYRDSFMEGAA